MELLWLTDKNGNYVPVVGDFSVVDYEGEYDD